MNNREAHLLAAWLVKQPTQEGGARSIAVALKDAHRLVNEPTLDIWRQQVVLPMLPLIPGLAESIEYLDIDVKLANNRSTLTGEIVAITDTRIVYGQFRTFDNIYSLPTATAKSWPRSTVHTIRLDELEVPDLDDEDEPWNASGTLALKGDDFNLTLPTRPGREHAIAKLAASFSR